MPNVRVRAQAKKRPASAAPSRRPNQSNQVLTLAKLIGDPCNGPLVGPQYGSSDGGYLAKFSSYHKHDVSTTGTSGYVVWFPDFTGGADTGGNGALYIFATTDSTVSPINTVSDPLGRGSSAATINGNFLEDPSHTFLTGSVVQDARTVAACVKMIYTGRNDSLAGRIGYLDNIPREALLTGAGGSPPSVEDMFRYSPNSMRTPLDLVENKFRPTEGSEYYRTAATSTGSDKDRCFTIGNGAATSIGSGTPSGLCPGIGFVWDGLTSDSALAFDFVKAVEWRPDMTSGLTAAPTHKSTGVNVVSKAVSYLDTKHPGWQRLALRAAKSAGAAIAGMASEGAKNQIMRSAPLLLTMI